MYGECCCGCWGRGEGYDPGGFAGWRRGEGFGPGWMAGWRRGEGFGPGRFAGRGYVGAPYFGEGYGRDFAWGFGGPTKAERKEWLEELRKRLEERLSDVTEEIETL